MNNFFRKLFLDLFTRDIKKIEIDYVGTNGCYLMSVHYKNGTLCVHAIEKETNCDD